MIKTFKRILLIIFSKLFKTDEIADKFPVSLKVAIIDDSRVLLLKNERNEWDLPGGKINFGEIAIDCLQREIKEETNLEINNVKLVDFFSTIFFNQTAVLIVLYKAKILSANHISISFEHFDYNFFSKNEIISLNCPEEYKKSILELL